MLGDALRGAARLRAGGAATNVGGGVHQGVAHLGTVQEGRQLVVFGDEGALDGRYGTRVASGPQCWPNLCTAHPSLRQTPCVAMLKGLLFKFDTPYVLANVCEAVPETMSLPSKSVLPNPKNTPAAAFCRRYQNLNLSNQMPSTVISGIALGRVAYGGSARPEKCETCDHFAGPCDPGSQPNRAPRPALDSPRSFKHDSALSVRFSAGTAENGHLTACDHGW
jgi:hypothetical protein